MAERVRVTGPLEQPEFTPLKRTIAGYVAGGLLANAMRPASAVARTLGLTDEREYEDPCAAPLVDPTAQPPSWLQNP